jgi:hypothetical protein
MVASGAFGKAKPTATFMDMFLIFMCSSQLVLSLISSTGDHGQRRALRERLADEPPAPST